MQKNFIFLLAFASLTACDKPVKTTNATAGTISVDTSVAAPDTVSEEEIMQTMTPDMARNEINSGDVKRIIMHIVDKKADTTSFDKSGIQIYPSTYSVSRDNRGCVTQVYNRVEYDFKKKNFDYTENNCRLAYSTVREGYIELDGSEVGDGNDFRHYYYTDKTNNPSGFFEICCQDITPTYTEYNYLEFDKYGNWTKREAIQYWYEYDPAYNEQYETFIKNLNKVYPDFKQNQEELDIISLLKDCNHQPLKRIETRKVEYYSL